MVGGVVVVAEEVGSGGVVGIHVRKNDAVETYCVVVVVVVMIDVGATI